MAVETYKIKIDVETQTASIRDLRGQVVATKIPVKQLRQEFGNFAKTVNATKFKQFNREIQGTKGIAGGMKKFQKSTGGAATSVLELGRVVSDAPYGIRGMANNVSQLASNMLFGAQQIDKATGKAVGFGNVIKGMGKAFIGPLGILFAIQAVVAGFDYLYGGMKKTVDKVKEMNKEIKELTDKVYAQDLVAKKYLFTLEDLNTSEKDRKIAAQELIKIIPTLKDEDEKYGINLDDVREKIKKYTLAQANRIEMDKLVESNSALLSKKSRLDSIKAMEDKVAQSKAMKQFLEDEGKELTTTVEKFVGTSQYGASIVHKTIREKTIAELKQDFDAIGITVDAEAKPIMEKVDRLMEGLDVGSKKKDKFKGKRVSSVLGFELIDFMEVEKRAKKYGNNLIKAVENFFGVEMKSDPLKIVPELDLLHTAQTQAKIDAYQKSVMDGLVKASELEDLQERIGMVKGALSTITDFTDSEFERELTIEQNKTNALNNELNKRLQNEDLSKNQRQSIQNQIAQNDEKLRIKQEAIERKKFKMQKAANIANALMDTYSAAAGVLADTKGGSFVISS